MPTREPDSPGYIPNAFTTKFLVAITPSGFICFVSKCYGGSATDSYITVNCGLLNHILAGDLVLFSEVHG